MSNETNIMFATYPTINYEEKTLDDLKEFRKRINVTQISTNNGDHEALAYLIRMVDILLKKVDRLENDN